MTFKYKCGYCGKMIYKKGVIDKDSPSKIYIPPNQVKCKCGNTLKRMDFL